MEEDTSRIAEELTTIRKELEKISLILEYAYVPRYKVERKKVDGEIVRIHHTLQAPLEELSKALHRDRQHQTS